MADEKAKEEGATLTAQQRQDLEGLLAACRKADLPGDGQLIKLIEATLAGKPVHDPRDNSELKRE